MTTLSRGIGAEDPSSSSSSALGCPTCQRDFEIPRRYRIKPDDMDYQVIPRLLNCLHTCCHSCSEEAFQRQNGHVICPICRKSQRCKAVKYLPLDVSVLSEVLNTGGATAIAFCCRCHDEIPSFSWCFSCHSALCEFHHQDHKLSIDTRGHFVSTLREITEERIKIEPQLPPIACPEVLSADVSLLCKTCGYMISAQAMIENHKGHNVVDSRSALNSCSQLLNTCTQNVQESIGSLMSSVENIKDVLQQLDEDAEAAAADLDFHFKALHEELAAREVLMLRRLEEITSRKRRALTDQLDLLSDALENCRLVNMKTESVLDYNALSNTVLSNWEQTQRVNDGLPEMARQSISAITGAPVESSKAIVNASENYLISSTKILADRSKVVVETAAALPTEPAADPIVKFVAEQREIEHIQTIVRSLGAFRTTDADPFYHNGPPASRSGVNRTSPAEAKDGSDFEEKQITKSADLRNLSFTVKTGPPSRLASLSNARAENFLLIEIRDSEKTLGNGRIDTGLKASSTDGDADGTLLGQVLIETEVDRRFFPRHEVLNTLESLQTDGIPVIRVTNEISAQNQNLHSMRTSKL